MTKLPLWMRALLFKVKLENRLVTTELATSNAMAKLLNLPPQKLTETRRGDTLSVVKVYLISCAVFALTLLFLRVAL